MAQEVAVVESRPQLVKLSDVAIETIAYNMTQAEKLVFRVLEKDIDYGRLPGIPQEGLWDPGASKIINAFNSYPDYKILHRIEEDGLISYTIQSLIMSRDIQQIVGTGIGACSTRETKYKYRWVPDPQNYGYSEEMIKTLKTKTKNTRDGPVVEYRIENPEYGELVNTVAKMAAKRADVDAAQSLPGVGSALRKLFQGGDKAGPNWNTFWSQVQAMGLKESDAHELLKVKSMKEWLASGRSLSDAIRVLAERLAERAEQAARVAKQEVNVAKQPASPRRNPDEVKPEEVPDGYALEKVANQCWGMQPKQVWDELNYTSVKNFEEAKVEKAWDCFLKLKEVRKPLTT